MHRYLCIHGHFYQPPRENAWLEKIEVQPSAFPYHDWNERITKECYYPNAFSRVLNDEGKIVDIVDNYAKMSFNFGPTLLSWMEQHAPITYQAILDSDKLSQKHFNGHGSAMAQVYNHMIMPLANTRDKETQIIWGIKDFKARFGRMPEGMWLGEAAVDTETLDLLAKHGIKFTLLAPNQAKRFRKKGDKTWTDGIDSNRHYDCNLPSGRKIALFFYDGERSQNVAFKGVLQNGKSFAHDLLEGYRGEYDNEFVHIATDGESYGHHHANGDMALAYCLRYIEENDLTTLTNYSQYLAMFEPEYEVEIHEDSSWSCAHGVERWRSNCGCHTGGGPNWNQEWRTPLRNGLDMIRDQMIEIYEEGLNDYCDDVWAMREDYITVIMDRSKANIHGFLKKHIKQELNAESRTHVMRLLEMQRNAMLMYTSCGWFFNDISGIETIQVLQYACRAIQLAESESDVRFEQEFINELSKANSNIHMEGNGAQIYEKHIKPFMLSLTQVGMHYAVASIFADEPETLTVLNYDCKSVFFERKSAGLQRLAYGTTIVDSKVTTSTKEFSFVVLYMGQHHMVGGTSKRLSTEQFEPIATELEKSFMESNIADVLRIIQKNFKAHTFSFFGMFKDEQMHLLENYLEQSEQLAYDSMRKIYDRNYNILNVMRQNKLQIPATLKQNIDNVINYEFRELFTNGHFSVEKMHDLVTEVQKWNIPLHEEHINSRLNDKLDELFLDFERDTSNLSLLNELMETISLYKQVGLKPLLINLQNNVLSFSRSLFADNGNVIDAQQIVKEKIEELAKEIDIDLSLVKEAVANT